MTDERIKNELIGYLESLEEYEIADVWNEYIERENFPEDRVYPMYELCDLMSGLSFRAALDQLQLDSFRFSDDWLIESMSGYRSFSDLFDVVELDEIADYVMNHYDDIENDYYPGLFKLAEQCNELREEA